MSNSEKPIFLEQEIGVAETQELKDFDLSSESQLTGYKEWKKKIPAEIRSLVEAHFLDKKVRLDSNDLPLAVEFYQVMEKMLASPQTLANSLDVSAVVAKQILALQQMKIKDEEINLFAALADSNIGFDVKANYIETKLLPRLDFLRAKDKRFLEKIKTGQSEIKVNGEPEEEEYTPHRAAEEELEGMPSQAVATVAPFYGGYYADAMFDQFDSATLTWKSSARAFRELPAQQIDEACKRIYCSSLRQGQATIKLPRGWGINQASLGSGGQEELTGQLVSDQNGLIKLRTESSETTSFFVEIGPSADTLVPEPPSGHVETIVDRFPAELIADAERVMDENVSLGIKLRRIASLIHNRLEYDKDPAWETVYKADPSLYFESIWQHKKAKCDEANTILARLLTKFGLEARFVGGHSVRAKSEAGEALLLESNRHAWVSAWDSEKLAWLRLDATPAGDPNVDQEQQEEDLGEGDFGEQEAELMSEEELEKRLAEAEAQKEEQAEREDPVVAYAKEAECSVEEAREVLQKIETLRQKYAGILRQADRYWQRLVRSQWRERMVDRGPVPMSQMDEIDPDELVSGYIEIIAGEKDPLIGQKEIKERSQEKWFGGYEVYIAADMSGSMEEAIGGAQKVEMQRDMIILLADSIMNAAVAAKKAAAQLKAPMPVKVCVAVFGAKTEIILPLTETWGPKEQISLYRALDAGAGGGTPDHYALNILGRVIQQSTVEEATERQKPGFKKHDWRMRRFVIATADGGSNNPGAVKEINEHLKEQGIPVDLFLISSADDKLLHRAAASTYQSVSVIPDTNQLAEQGLKRLSERIQEAYKE
ncbi:MAG: transglutaminase domain-containing protein [Patescibacteria group bacterium]